MSYETRPQTYDETIRVLGKKDYRGIAEFVLPVVKEADEISLEHAKLSIPDMIEMDFLAKVNINEESFILHIEFESAYKSNTEMLKRMLKYYTYIKWHNDLPIYQVLMVLKEPTNVKNIEGSFKSTVQDLDVMQYQYKVIKAYEIDKYEVLKDKQVVLYPLRVFMKHDGESEEEHILECLTAVESLPDKDYYFLTVQCVKKLYEKSKYKKFVKEEIIMQSSLYREPYEKGKVEGEAKMVIKLLTKRFGVIPPELRKRIESLDSETLDRIMDEALSYESIKDVEKTLQ
ncbi:DUF4351 domain-containing protein [Xylanivirga thermophila]|uniref:DUF4351 domain-containing protein n=1 Tax=Xylanivirga thermophila TaxID=2496273 RepID=UPI00101B6B19|nr:DUF4351 domain-containing protein [Xylanivirga thermophila]